METYGIIAEVGHACLFSAGVSFNGLLIFLIIFKTPKAFRPYSILVLNHAITDIVGCFADFSVQARVIPTDWSLAYMVNGFCQYISPQACNVGFALQLQSYSHSLYLLLICFTYRYLIITSKVPSIKRLLLVIFLAWIPSTLQTLCFIRENADSEVIGAIVKARHPYHNFDGKLFSGSVSIFQPLTSYAIFHLTMSPTPIYIAILTLRNKIEGVLDMSACHMREHTKEMHRQLLKALTIQALLPMLDLAAVMMYFLILFDIYDHPILEYADLIIVQTIPTITALISLLYIRPYREAISNFISWNLLGRSGGRDEAERKKSSFSIRDSSNGAPGRLMSISFI